MTNEQRRRALNLARSKALDYAREADHHYMAKAEDGPEVNLAVMWAAVANAMKDGDPAHDSVTGSVTDGVTDLSDLGAITR